MVSAFIPAKSEWSHKVEGFFDSWHENVLKFKLVAYNDRLIGSRQPFVDLEMKSFQIWKRYTQLHFVDLACLF